MTNYELLYIVPNQYTDDEAKKIEEKINTFLQKQDAILGFKEFLGKKKLAYPINKIAHGYYIVVEFELEDETKVSKISNELRLDKEILRAQIIKKHKITPQEIARQKKQREEVKDGDKERSEERPAPRVEKNEKDKRVSIENLDEKLNEILNDDSVL